MIDGTVLLLIFFLSLVATFVWHACECLYNVWKGRKGKKKDS